MEKADFHSDRLFCDFRTEPEISGRQEQLEGRGSLSLVFQSVYDRFPEYAARFGDKKEARRQYAQTINGILDAANCDDSTNIVRTKMDLDIPELKGILHIEGLNTVTTEEELLRLTHLWEKGVRSIGPIYGNETIIGGGNAVDESIGLQPIGKKIILKVAQLGMSVDLAHCNRRTKDDIFELLAKSGTEANIAYTHGSLFDSAKPDMRQRAIEKSQVQEIIRRGGVVGISVSRPFVNSVKKAVEQIMTVAEMSNFESVGIGTDFGGLENTDLLGGARSYCELYDTLGDLLTNQSGVNDTELEKLFGGNIFGFARKMLPEN